MPTGYTANIVDGKEITFEQFAKQCMRAFGATIHMREDRLDKEYEPRKPHGRYEEKVEELQAELDGLNNTSDEELKQKEIKRLKDSIHDERQRILEKAEIRNRLEGILGEARMWKAPTDDHINFKNFMIEQLESTIEWDTDTKWNEESIQTSERRLDTIDELDLRQEELERIEDQIEYYKKSHQGEVERCKKSNEWVDILVNSL